MNSRTLTTSLTLISLSSIPTTCHAQWDDPSLDGYDVYGGGPAFHAPRQSGGWTAYAAAAWVSRYMERGYQRFGNAGAFGIMLGGGYSPVGADLEQRLADTNGSREFRGNLRATHDFNDLEIATRATYVSDLRGNPSYWDLGLGAAGNLAWSIRWQSELIYGTETKNFHADAGLEREWALGAEWKVKASTGFGVNLGYQRDAAKGIDHAMVGLDIARSLGPQSTIFGGVSHYAPINRDTAKYVDHRDLYDGFVFQLGARWDY